MPQLDIFSYNIQCFLLTIYFFFFFYFFYNIVLIQLLKIFKIRIFINFYINNIKKNIKVFFIKYNLNYLIKFNYIYKILLNYKNFYNLLFKYKLNNICIL
jgi:hypothetical protein